MLRLLLECKRHVKLVFTKTRVLSNLKVRHFSTFSISRFHCILVVYGVYKSVKVKRGQKMGLRADLEKRVTARTPLVD
jgi:hypothetical protein